MDLLKSTEVDSAAYGAPKALSKSQLHLLHNFRAEFNVEVKYLCSLLPLISEDYCTCLLILTFLFTLLLFVRAEDSRSEKNSEIYNDFKPKIKELEMLSEAYFAQIDGVLQKLSDMSEYVGDMEDCINIMLDETQNKLLQMGVIL
ncbi:hypothetical protein Patl1_34889 [Pistacia atlantica]|uniref:Uncharacterized protein n=1 Tax=Pistacia atlantica TaxID=434234 RepID=A0ACC0ZP43_9ROSI|nr:hypothetical protein Patl1_34889 [Pistacia atlantica]